MSQKDVVVIANIAGSTPDEYLALAEKLNESAVHLVELNISCPNVKAGGASFGTTCASAEYITKLVRNACKKPLIVKLTRMLPILLKSLSRLRLPEPMVSL